MRHAFHVFAPYRAARKVAIFGSARTQPDDPLYVQARDFAAAMAALDWMVVTGAGPGIMEAGIEGAGAENAFGVSIELPFETTTSQFIADDPKLINFRYFFTRKLEFIKESDAFVLLPGGYGTLDEAFELLTLLQTGKAQPAPVDHARRPRRHLLGALGRVRRRASSSGRGYVSLEDDHLFCVTDTHRDRGRRDPRLLLATTTRSGSCGAASCCGCARRRRPTSSPRSTATSPTSWCAARSKSIAATPEEIADDDHVDLARVAFRFDRHGWARLRMLIDRLNDETATLNLTWRSSMPDVDPIPAGYPRVTPYLCCRDASAAIDFYRRRVRRDRAHAHARRHARAPSATPSSRSAPAW